MLRAQMILVEENQNKMDKAVHDKLELILEQTTKTNVSVVELKKDVKELQTKTHELELADVKHEKDCPLASEIKDIHQNLIAYNFFKQNPVFAWGTIVFIAASVIIAAVSLLK